MTGFVIGGAVAGTAERLAWRSPAKKGGKRKRKRGESILNVDTHLPVELLEYSPVQRCAKGHPFGNLTLSYQHSKLRRQQVRGPGDRGKGSAV